MKPWWKTRQEERERERQEKRKERSERAKERKAQKQADYDAMSDEEKAEVDRYNEKKKLVSRINSRMRKTVDKLGTEQREYSKFLGRIQASSTLELPQDTPMNMYSISKVTTRAHLQWVSMTAQIKRKLNMLCYLPVLRT